MEEYMRNFINYVKIYMEQDLVDFQVQTLIYSKYHQEMNIGDLYLDHYFYLIKDVNGENSIIVNKNQD